MSKMHVLEGDSAGNCKIVVHVPVPTGSNIAGISWKQVGLSCNMLGSTVLLEGTGPAQITIEEKAQVLAGDMVEIQSTVPVESGGATDGSLNAMADQIISSYLIALMARLKYYGMVRES